MGRVILSLVTVVLVTVSLFGCKPGENTDNIDIKQAPIHELRISFAESFPIQVFLYIQGGLADGCTKFHGVEIKSRSGNDIKIELTVERPRDAICPAIYTYFEQNINLGTDFKAGETYSVTVNDKNTSFVMQ